MTISLVGTAFRRVSSPLIRVNKKSATKAAIVL